MNKQNYIKLEKKFNQFEEKLLFILIELVNTKKEISDLVKELKNEVELLSENCIGLDDKLETIEKNTFDTKIQFFHTLQKLMNSFDGNEIDLMVKNHKYPKVILEMLQKHK